MALFNTQLVDGTVRQHAEDSLKQFQEQNIFGKMTTHLERLEAIDIRLEARLQELLRGEQHLQQEVGGLIHSLPSLLTQIEGFNTLFEQRIVPQLALRRMRKMNAIQAFAREGDGENLLKCIEAGVPVSLKDSKGQTALHWAVDRGHLNIIELLVAKNADVNAKDNKGQGPLHYAAVCDREAIAKFLVKQNARTDMKDNDGNTPYDLCDMKWPWLQNAVA
ncbi:hypothetical protein U1Q18_031800 [Sarracenia purpurea var. burkii]